MLARRLTLPSTLVRSPWETAYSTSFFYVLKAFGIVSQSSPFPVANKFTIGNNAVAVKLYIAFHTELECSKPVQRR